MKSFLKKTALSVALILALTGVAQAGRTTTDLGNWIMDRSGIIQVSIVEENGRKSGMISVADNHVIDSVFFLNLTKDQLIQLRALIDAAIAALE